MSRDIPEWCGKTDNTPAPDRVKERIARKADDRCAKCTRKIDGKLRAEYDHAIPLILGGENRETNLQLICNECHAEKTKLDVKIKAKVARIRKRNLRLVRHRTITRWRRFDGSIREAGRDR